MKRIIFYYYRLVKYTFNFNSDFYKSINENKVLFDGEISPWFTTSFLHFMQGQNLKINNVFEYGSGSSTIYWSNLAQKVVSVEHDPKFYFFIKSKTELFKNIELKLRPNDLDLYKNCISENNTLYDLIVVDGVNRENIIRITPDFLTENGVIILDNSHRLSYKEGIDFLLNLGFKKISFWGLPVLSPHMSETTIFYRNNNCFNI